MTKEELDEIRERAQRAQDKYPLTPITTNGLCTGIFTLLDEIERLQDILAWFDREGDLKL